MKNYNIENYVISFNHETCTYSVHSERTGLDYELLEIMCPDKVTTTDMTAIFQIHDGMYSGMVDYVFGSSLIGDDDDMCDSMFDCVNIIEDFEIKSNFNPAECLLTDLL